MDTVRIVISLLLAALLAMTGGGKVLGAGKSVEVRDALGLSPALWRLIGAMELSGVAGLVVGIWLPVLGGAAAVGVVLLMIGAAGSRLRASDAGVRGPAGLVTDAVVAVLAGVVAVLGFAAA
ncbi:DoxX family protein [Streptomyces sp. NPDC127084]|uniref:DoxX family protein n=1 Tax=Streptomyces sp. NPDC127084 TaxID=3347133 RepID=UPI00366896C8